MHLLFCADDGDRETVRNVKRSGSLWMLCIFASGKCICYGSETGQNEKNGYIPVFMLH